MLTNNIMQAASQSLIRRKGEKWKRRSSRNKALSSICWDHWQSYTNELWFNTEDKKMVSCWYTVSMNSAFITGAWKQLDVKRLCPFHLKKKSRLCLSFYSNILCSQNKYPVANISCKHLPTAAANKSWYCISTANIYYFNFIGIQCWIECLVLGEPQEKLMPASMAAQYKKARLN